MTPDDILMHVIPNSEPNIEDIRVSLIALVSSVSALQVLLTENGLIDKTKYLELANQVSAKMVKHLGWKQGNKDAT